MHDSTTSQINPVGLLRHSVTLWNEKKILQGQNDSPLSPRGIKMALEWGIHLKPCGWDMILASDLGRAVATAELINQALDIPVHVDAGLREQDWGSWTGMTLQQIKKKNKKQLKEEIAKGWLMSPPGGESREMVLGRATSAIRTCFDKNPDSKILVICHEGVIKCLVYSLLQRNFLPDEQKILAPYNLHLIFVGETSLSLSTINSYQLPVF